MAKRNQYNRPNFRQLSPMNFGKPIEFNTFIINSGAYLTIPTEQLGGTPPVHAAAIAWNNPATWPLDGFGGALENGARASQIWRLSDVTLTEGNAFFVQVLNPQVTVQSIVFLELVSATDNGVNGTIFAQTAGTFTIQITSNGSALTNNALNIIYYILNPA